MLLARFKVRFSEVQIRKEHAFAHCDCMVAWLEATLVPRGQKRILLRQTFDLDGQRVWVFGSTEEHAHIVLACSSVDARHAALVAAEAADGSTVWELVDYGGDNGTFLNGERVSRARVCRLVRGGGSRGGVVHVARC